MALLRILVGENSGKLVPVDQDTTALGRDSEQLPILDAGVSRKHAEIFQIGELYFIRDLASRNGTFVNDNKVSDQEILRNGDQIQVGNTVMCFEDTYARQGDSRLLEFKDSVDLPDATIVFQLSTADSSTKTAENEHQRLKVLYRISRILGAGNKVSEIMHNVAKELCQSLGADDVYLFEFKDGDDNETQFVDIASYHNDPNKSDLPISKSILKRVAKDGVPILTSDAALDDRFSAAASIVIQKIKSVLAVPLMFMNKPIGAFYAVNNRKAENFNSEDLELATIVGMLAGNALETWEALEKQSRVYRNVLKTIAAVTEMRTPDHRGESERIGNFAAAIARTAGLNNDDVRHLWIAGLLNDIGAMALSESELLNSVNLEQRKAKHAAELLENLPELEDVRTTICQHTERMDGSGFPEGLKKDQICHEAYIVGLACEFDHLLTNGNGDGKELSLKQVVVQIKELAGKKFPVDVVNSLLVSYRRGTLFMEEKNLFEIGH